MKPENFIGHKVIRKNIPDEHWDTYTVKVVRNLDDLQVVTAIRSATFMHEQDCPFSEEFDGNDLVACHLLVYKNSQPIGTLRLRWFSEFGKVERVCILQKHRGSAAVQILLAFAFEISARKGYRWMYAQIQARLWPVWSRMLHCKLRKERETFSFSGYDYREIDIPIPEHTTPISKFADPFVIIRPEGEWDSQGVLEPQSTNLKNAKAA